MNIRTKFLAVMLSLVLITGMATILIGRTVSTNIIEEQVGNYLETTAQSRAHHIETVVREYRQETGTLAVGISFRNVVDKSKNHTECIEIANLRINSTIESYEYISRIRILDKSGIIIASSHADVGSDKSTSGIFLKGREEIYVGDIHTSLFTGNNVMSAAAPIMVDGKFSGVLIINFDVEEIFEILTDRTGLGETGEIFIVNRDGYMITPSRFINDTLPKQDVDPEHFIGTENYEPVATLYNSYRGVDVLGAHAPIPEMNWCLWAEIGEEEAFTPVTRLTATLFSILAGLLLLGTLICIRVSGTITDPIVKLHRGTEEIVNGNLDYKVGTETVDEVGELSRAFDTMTANLKESGRELERYSKGLEKKVKERTARLDELLAESERQRVAIFNMLEDVTETKDDLVLMGDQLRQKSEEQKALLSTIPAFVYFKGRDGNYIAANKAFADMTGTSVDEIAGKTDYDFFLEERADAYRADDQEVMESGEPKYNIEELTAGADGKPMWISTSKTPFFGHGGIVIGMVGITHDITERKSAEERIEHLNSVLKAIRDVDHLIVTEKDRDHLLKNACDILIEARGYEAAWLGHLSDDETFDTVVGSGFRKDADRFCESVMDRNHPPCIKKALAGNELVTVVDKSGECGDCLFKDVYAGRETAVIRVERGGKLFGLLAISLAADVNLNDEEAGLLEEVASDIALALNNMEVEDAHKIAQDRIKASLKEKEVLLREIHHRVKNNLQVVSSLLDMQARRAKNKDAIDALTESKNRLNAMALIHAQLYESSNLAEINMKSFVSKLLMQLFQSYPVQGTKITPVVSVADYPVPISMAVPVGLIVNELLSNALKHAFVDRVEGKIEVNLTASEEGKINMTVSDDGVGLPPGFDINKTGTLGLRLIKILTEDQLHGTLKVIRDEGTTFNIEFNIRY